MGKNEFKLAKNITSVAVELNVSDISIYPDNVSVPIVRTAGKIDVTERYNEAVIKEMQPKVTGSFNHSSIFINNCVIYDCSFTSGSSRNIFYGHSGEEASVELIVPKKSQIQEFRVDLKSGNLTISDLLFFKLVAKTMNGSINLHDIDLLFGRLKTMNGNIDVRILESIINYRTYLKTLNGDMHKNTIETISPILLDEKHELEATSLNGDINVLFKGRRRK